MEKLRNAALVLLLSSVASIPYAEAGDLHKVAARGQTSHSTSTSACFNQTSEMVAYLEANGLQSVASLEKSDGKGELVYMQKVGTPFNRVARGELWIVQSSGRMCPLNSFPELVVFDKMQSRSDILEKSPALRDYSGRTASRFTALAARASDGTVFTLLFEDFDLLQGAVWREEPPGTMVLTDAGEGESSYAAINEYLRSRRHP